MTKSPTGGPALAAAKFASSDALHALQVQQTHTAQLIRDFARGPLVLQLEKLAAAESAARAAYAGVAALGGTPATVDAPLDRISGKWGAPYVDAIAALTAVRTHEESIEAARS